MSRSSLSAVYLFDSPEYSISTLLVNVLQGSHCEGPLPSLTQVSVKQMLVRGISLHASSFRANAIVRIAHVKSILVL